MTLYVFLGVLTAVYLNSSLGAEMGKGLWNVVFDMKRVIFGAAKTVSKGGVRRGKCDFRGISESLKRRSR